MRRTVGLVAGVVILAVAVVALGPGEVLGVVGAADPALVAASVAVGVASVVGHAEAFRRLRRRLEPTPGSARFHAAYYGAHFVKLTLPVGSASFPAVLAYVMSREADTAFEEDLAVATAANLLGYTTSFLLAFVGLSLYLATGEGLANGPVRLAAVAVGTVLVVALSTLAVLVCWPSGVDRLVLGGSALIRSTVGRVSDRARAAVREEAVAERLTLFHGTIALLRTDRRAVVAATFLTAVSWVLAALPLWLSFMAVGQWVPFAVVLFSVPAANLVAAVPLPGGLGGVEFALGTVVVAATGVAVPLAAAAVLLHRLATYWTPLLVGGLSSVFVSVEASRPAR